MQLGPSGLVQLAAAGGSGGGGWPLSNAEGGGAGAGPAAPRGGGVIPAPGPELLSPPPALLFLSPREEREREGAAPRGAGPCAGRAGEREGGRDARGPRPHPGSPAGFPTPPGPSPARVRSPAPLVSEAPFSPFPHNPHFPTPRASLCGPPHFRPPNPGFVASHSDLSVPGPGPLTHPRPLV